MVPWTAKNDVQDERYAMVPWMAKNDVQDERYVMVPWMASDDNILLNKWLCTLTDINFTSGIKADPRG
jgi:hypothetical protein